MATRYGHLVYEWLLDRGWHKGPKPSSKNFVCGDPSVIDPVDGAQCGVYLAAKLQRERTGEYPDFLPEGW